MKYIEKFKGSSQLAARSGVDVIAQLGTEICLSIIDLSKTVIYTRIDMPEDSLRL